MDLDFKRLRYVIIPKPIATHQPCSEFLLNLDLSLQETLGSMLLPGIGAHSRFITFLHQV